LNEAGRNCSRCGNILRLGGANCGRCGAPVSSASKPIADAPASIFLDTIHLRGESTADARQTGIRPALAVLFRVAVGPSADYYAPRFLGYERAGRGAPGWHWPSFLMPSVWAFYRKLWLAGVAFAMLPVAGAFAFAAIADRIDNATLPWLLAAILAIWFLPGVIPAIVANSLLYRRVRNIVARAEASTGSASQVASLLARGSPTSLAAGLLLGGATLMLAAGIVEPSLRGAWFEHEVRAKVAAALATVQPLQEQVEDSWNRVRAIPLKLDVDALRIQAATAFFDEVSFRPANGRLRLGMGRSIPELFGRSILLVPAVDASQQIQWMCIPVDIPAKFLPKECRKK
jgi:Pilin (bacterial filament)/Protein of unknown function (DUF2628)